MNLSGAARCSLYSYHILQDMRTKYEESKKELDELVRNMEGL